MSVLSPQDAQCLDRVLDAACRVYACDTRDRDLKKAIDTLDTLLRDETAYQQEASPKTPQEGTMTMLVFFIGLWTGCILTAAVLSMCRLAARSDRDDAIFHSKRTVGGMPKVSTHGDPCAPPTAGLLRKTIVLDETVTPLTSLSYTRMKSGVGDSRAKERAMTSRPITLVAVFFLFASTAAYAQPRFASLDMSTPPPPAVAPLADKECEGYTAAQCYRLETRGCPYNMTEKEIDTRGCRGGYDHDANGAVPVSILGPNGAEMPPPMTPAQMLRWRQSVGLVGPDEIEDAWHSLAEGEWRSPPEENPPLDITPLFTQTTPPPKPGYAASLEMAEPQQSYVRAYHPQPHLEANGADSMDFWIPEGTFTSEADCLQQTTDPHFVGTWRCFPEWEWAAIDAKQQAVPKAVAQVEVPLPRPRPDGWDSFNHPSANVEDTRQLPNGPTTLGYYSLSMQLWIWEPKDVYPTPEACTAALKEAPSVVGTFKCLSQHEAARITAEQETEVPLPKPRPQTPPPKQTAQAQRQPAPARQPTQAPQPLVEPFRTFIDVVMLPWDFLSYPGRRDW